MAELNLKQIIDKLNNEFKGDVRKLVFWYDANAEFKDDIETMELENAKILHLEPDNQFYIKYFLKSCLLMKNAMPAYRQCKVLCRHIPHSVWLHFCRTKQ